MKVAIIGVGPVAVAAALYVADKAIQVTLINTGKLGGSSIDTLRLTSAITARAAQTVHQTAAHPFTGIETHRSLFDLPQHLAQRQARVEELRRRKYDIRLKDNKYVTLLRGTARFHDRQTLVVDTKEGDTHKINADRILIATSSFPYIPDVAGLAEIPYWTWREALMADRLPDHMLIIGGSAVAVEMGQTYQRLGSNVTLIARSSLLSQHDPAIGTALRGILEKEGMSIITDATPVAARFNKGIFSVKLPKGDLRGDALLVATGRTPNTCTLQLEKAGIAVDGFGSIKIDRSMRTTVANIYAAGDCTDIPQLVHVADIAGRRAAANMLGDRGSLDPSLIPIVIHTDPQIANVGLTETQAGRHGLTVLTRTLTLEHVPGAAANFDTRGLIKLVADKNSGRILGAQLLTPNAGELVQCAALAIQDKMTVHQIGELPHPNLSMSEALKLCAQSFYRDPAHLPA